MVKNLLFDFGNVLFDLDLSRIPAGFKRLWGPSAESVRAQLFRERFFEDWETGGFAEADFLERLASFNSKNGSPEDVRAIWNSIFVALPRHRFEMMLPLRQRFGVFMLSNINPTHADWIDAHLAREHGWADWQAVFFDKVYYSHLIRLRKPDADVFEHVLADAEIRPEETLFIDDLPENIEAARRLGFQTRLHPVGAEVADFLTERFGDIGLQWPEKSEKALF